MKKRSHVLTFAVWLKKHLKTSAPDRGGGIQRTSTQTGKILTPGTWS